MCKSSPLCGGRVEGPLKLTTELTQKEVTSYAEIRMHIDWMSFTNNPLQQETFYFFLRSQFTTLVGHLFGKLSEDFKEDGSGELKLTLGRESLESWNPQFSHNALVRMLGRLLVAA
jgi:hypothetical protein